MSHEYGRVHITQVLILLSCKRSDLPITPINIDLTWLAQTLILIWPCSNAHFTLPYFNYSDKALHLWNNLPSVVMQVAWYCVYYVPAQARSQGDILRGFRVTFRKTIFIYSGRKETEYTWGETKPIITQGQGTTPCTIANTQAMHGYFRS